MANGTSRFAEDLLRLMLSTAVEAANPQKILAKFLPPKPSGRCIVVGAGKAAASMAAAVEEAWPDVLLSGIVTVPYGYGLACDRIAVREAGHPVPDENSVSAATDILSSVSGLTAADLVLALISGGGSAAMCLPAPGISLKDKQTTNRLLLSSGLDIRTMNAVRRRLSGIKGGKLAFAAQPARMVTLGVSDIPGDDPTAIASGPTTSDPTSQIDLNSVVDRLGSNLPASVAAILRQSGQVVDTSNASDFRLIATPARSLEAAAAVAKANGVSAIILGDGIEGESRDVAAWMAAQVRGAVGPTVFISGGETTVTIGGDKPGRGGRNTEFALALACELDGLSGVWALAADTDGEDGANLGAAGAVIGPETIERARGLNLDPRSFLSSHDSGSFFSLLGDLVKTGPTRTNVNDFRAILVLPLARATQE